METYYAEQMPPNHRRAVISSVLIVVVALIIAGAVWWSAKRDQQVKPNEEAEYSIDLPHLSAASRAKIPVDFPTQYILGTNAEVIAGDIVDRPETNTTTREVTVRAENTPQDLIAKYEDYLTHLGWMIKASNSSAEGGSLSASRGLDAILIAFTSGDRITQVNFKYIQGRYSETP